MRHFTLLFFLVCTSQLSIAQSRLFRTVTSVVYNDTMLTNGSSDQALYLNMNKVLPSISQPDDWEELTVPIVFHVLYTSEDDKVTERQIEEQMASLNRDFAGLSIPEPGDKRDLEGTFRQATTDTKIQFCFPQKGLLDLLLELVDLRQLTGSLPIENLNILKTGQVGLSALDTRKYLNVWIAPLPDGNAGFAQLPRGDSQTDGIVIDPRYFGSSGTAVAPYNQGKTLTQLVGTYLGLSPIWGDGGACGDDGIADTPVHNGPNYGSSEPGHASTCPGNPLEMTMNFMDAGDDDQLYMFTHGQAMVMRTVLQNSEFRGGILETRTNCRAAPNSDLMLSPSDISDEKQFIPLTLEVYPNPVSTQTSVRLSGPESKDIIAKISLYDLNGRIAFAMSGVENQYEYVIPTAGLQKGIYIVLVDTKGNQRFTKRITVQ